MNGMTDHEDELNDLRGKCFRELPSRYDLKIY